jgi:hypothetical protein
MRFGFPLDLERPTAQQMLAPLLRDVGSWRCVTYDDHLAVIALDVTIDATAIHIACRLHHALDRGLLVVL